MIAKRVHVKFQTFSETLRNMYPRGESKSNEGRDTSDGPGHYKPSKGLCSDGPHFSLEITKIKVFRPPSSNVQNIDDKI